MRLTRKRVLIGLAVWGLVIVSVSVALAGDDPPIQPSEPPDVVTPMESPPGYVLKQWHPIEAPGEGWGPPSGDEIVPTNPPRADLIDALGLEMPTLPADLSGVSRVRIVAYRLDPAEGPGSEYVNVLYTAYSGAIAAQRLVYESSDTRVADAPDGALTLVYEARLVDAVVEDEHGYREQRADLNGDGVIDAADVVLVTALAGATPSGCAADLTGNGTVDAADLARVLQSWGDCAAPVDDGGGPR